MVQRNLNISCKSPDKHSDIFSKDVFQIFLFPGTLIFSNLSIWVIRQVLSHFGCNRSEQCTHYAKTKISNGFNIQCFNKITLIKFWRKIIYLSNLFNLWCTIKILRKITYFKTKTGKSHFNFDNLILWTVQMKDSSIRCFN